jgi:hypothetical protein
MFSWRHFLFLFLGEGSWMEAVWSVLGNEGEGGGHVGFFCITKT